MLKKLILLLPLVVLLNISAKALAPFRYTFKDTTVSYTPLPANATSVNGTHIWDEEIFINSMPFTWVLDSTNQLTKCNLFLYSSGVYNNLNSSFLTGFTFGLVDLPDRGNIDSVASRSSIRYLVTGATPNRIFKLEIANAGFYTELDLYGTLNDSVNLQLWIYEGSNVVEIHYGSSQISHFNDYFDLGNGSSSVIIGLLHQISQTSQSGTFYYLTGAPASISVQSVSFPNTPSNGLAAWPANGKVFRFTPKVKPASISDLTALGNVKVYPNPASTSLHLEGVAAGTKATMYSMLGQPVLQTVVTGNQTLDIATLPAGVYKLVLTNKDGASGATTIVKE